MENRETVMEKSWKKLFAKSVETLACETFNGNSKILALIISKNNLIEVGKPDGEFILHIQGGGGEGNDYIKRDNSGYKP